MPSTANSIRETLIPEVFTVHKTVPETVAPFAGVCVTLVAVRELVVALA